MSTMLLINIKNLNKKKSYQYFYVMRCLSKTSMNDLQNVKKKKN